MTLFATDLDLMAVIAARSGDGQSSADAECLEKRLGRQLNRTAICHTRALGDLGMAFADPDHRQDALTWELADCVALCGKR